ncbi:MAG: DUF554 family protein [Verrucomicrobiae bacterium]|nr:DUF554 family protein [Verrucomicrobiae bacterium]
MLWIGLVVNAVAVVLGIGVGRLFQWNISKKAQVSLLSFLAALLIFSALRNGFYLFSQFAILPLLKAFFVSWVCLVISSIGFRKSPLHRIFSAYTKSAQDSISDSSSGLNNWKKAIRIGTAFYALSPLNFIACALVGIYSQTSESWVLIPFIVKALFDFIGSLSFSNSLGISSLAIAIPTSASQVLLVWIFAQAADLSFETDAPMKMCATAITVLYLCLHSAIVLLGWNKSVKLFPYTPALLLALIFDLLLF